jgi:hypothetical protein
MPGGAPPYAGRAEGTVTIHTGGSQASYLQVPVLAG